MREHHKHFGGWIIYWDHRTDHGFTFWIADSIDTPIDGSINTAMSHMGIFPTVADGLDTCEQIISDIIIDQTDIAFRRISDYHHSRNPSTATDTGNSDYIPF